MTRDEAIDAIKHYHDSLCALGAIISLESLAFGLQMQEIEKVLGVELAKPMVNVGLPSALSAYLAVLSNAVKGQGVTATVDEEWPSELNIGE